MSIGKESLVRVECVASHSIVYKLVQQSHVGDFIKSFRKIHKDGIHLAFSSAQLSDYTMESYDELGLATSTFYECMLVVTENAIGLKVTHDATVHDMFQNLTCYRCQRDWSIVTSLMFITLFEYGDDVGFYPIFGYCARTW